VDLKVQCRVWGFQVFRLLVGVFSQFRPAAFGPAGRFLSFEITALIAPVRPVPGDSFAAGLGMHGRATTNSSDFVLIFLDHAPGSIYDRFNAEERR
jgi:hypothetical protein